MTVYAIPRVLEDKLGPDGSDALAHLLHDVIEDEKKDVLSRIDEKVVARYNDIQRRSHEDVAGVELRLTNRMADLEARVCTRMSDLETRVEGRMAQLETKLGARMCDLETRLGTRMSDLETKLGARMADLEVRVRTQMHEFKYSIIRWFTGIVIVQMGLLTGLAWFTKHVL